MSARLIIVIMALAASLPAGFFLTWPEYRKFSQFQADLEQKKEELDSKTSYYAEIANLWTRLEEHQESLLKIDGAISDSYSLPALFNYLQQIAGGTGLILEDLSFAGVTGEAIKEISFNLEVSGSYASFKNFLKALEESNRFFNVKSVNFASPKTGQIFSFKMTVATYSY